MKYLKFNPPLAEGLIEEVTQFWEEIFASSYEGFMHQLSGAESGDNYNCIYLVREGERLLGTCCLTISRTLPQLGGLGEVATRPQYRRRGIAALLCEQARNDFRRQLGQALFLGTVNPEAARVYHRLGWRKLAGANVMALIPRGGSPEAFLVDYFSEEAAATAVPGSAEDRIPMIPLILCPHDWQVLDANVQIHSTRYATQSSCMGLYPRYQAMTRDGRGAWFAARTGTGRVVGLSSARLDANRGLPGRRLHPPQPRGRLGRADRGSSGLGTRASGQDLEGNPVHRGRGQGLALRSPGVPSRWCRSGLHT